MAEWNKNELPPEHELIENISFVTKIKDAWKTPDGTMRDKWKLVTQETEESQGYIIDTFSSTDIESIEVNTAYDVIVKKSPYGMTLKGFAKHGQAIPIKESTSRFEKSNKMNNRAIALQAVSNIYNGVGSKLLTDEALSLAELFLDWLNEKEVVTDTK